MKPSTAAIVSVFLLTSVYATPCNAQRFFQDYFSSNTYSPSDPWIKGRIFRTHTGHDGLYYNCDEEECKRNSPYIYWKDQGCRENIHTLKFVKKETRQTINDAICRWKRGSCQTCPPAVNYPPGAGYGTLASAEKAKPDSVSHKNLSEGQSIDEVHYPSISDDMEGKAIPVHQKSSLDLAPPVEPVQIQNETPKTQKLTDPKVEEVVPPLKPLINNKTSGLFPQNFIHGREPSKSTPSARIIGLWSPKSINTKVQKTAVLPKRSRGYGSLHRSQTNSTNGVSVIR